MDFGIDGWLRLIPGIPWLVSLMASRQRKRQDNYIRDSRGVEEIQPQMNSDGRRFDEG